jgi:phosphatidylglycerophosphate synthase
MRWLVTPNKITVLRMLVAGAAVGLYRVGSGGAAEVFGVCAVALTVCAVALDGVDGYVARRLRMATAVGAQLDILGDRVIENLFFIHFAVSGQISFWVPVIFFVRGVTTDFLRGLASTRGLATSRDGADALEFQKNWMLAGRWSARIVASRVSRGVYAALKCVCFCALGVEWIVARTQSSATNWNGGIHIAVSGIVYATAAFCIVRAVPVFWEGARNLRAVEPVHRIPVLRAAQNAVPVGARRIAGA